MEAEAAQAVSLDPLEGKRVERRLVGELGVKGGVEAGDVRQVAGQPAQRLQDPQRRPVMERREIAQASQALDACTVEQGRLAQLTAAVDDPVPDRVGPRTLDEIAESGRVDPIRRSGQVELRADLVGGVD